MKSRSFALHWRANPRIEIVTGRDIAEAVNKHYGGGALSALDYWEEVSADKAAEILRDQETVKS